MKGLLVGLSVLLWTLQSGSTDGTVRQPGPGEVSDPAVIGSATGAGPDCNANGVPDDTDIAEGTSQDCNGNGVPDECDTVVTFGPPGQISDLAISAQRVVAADLDGDSDLDILSASFGDDTIAWYENTDGAGTFGPEQIISTNLSFAISVFAADLDGDGDLDVLAAGAASDAIVWYENTDGLGTFENPNLITAQADGVWSVFAIDLDGDGDIDVVSASQTDNKVAWYENTDGLGAFGAQRVITTSAQNALSVVAADLDGDGDPDIASASSSDDTIAWYENSDGLGTFGPRQVISTEALSASWIDVADVDSDGDMDLLSASLLDNKIAWYEKLDDLDGFGPQQVISSTAIQALSVSTGDLDGDGDVDVLSASFGDDKITWYENTDGAGTFGPPRVVSSTAIGATFAIAADLDGDRVPDVVSSSQIDNRIAWYRNESDDCNANQVPDECEPDCNANGAADACDLGFEGSADCNRNSVPDECDIAQGLSDDCTGDGVPDECEADCNGNGEADSCDIDGETSTDCTGNGVPDECEPDCNGNGEADSCDIDGETSADCTGNGVPDECEPDCNGNSEADSCDIRVGFSSDCNVNEIPDECDVESASLDCNGNQIPDECETALRFTEHVITTEANFPRSVFAADLDGDGDPDALSASGLDDKLAWYENLDGLGSFGPQLLISTEADLPLSIFAADVDGDLDVDVLSASFGDDTIAWYKNANGAASFDPQQVISTAANGAQSVFAADVDGDGDVDVLSASFLDNEIAWYENLDGAGTYGPQRIISAEGAAVFSVFAADLDSDLDTDVLSASFGDDTIAWYENLDGAGTFGPRRIVSSSADGATAAIAVDIDGDSDSDIVSASQNDDTIAWYENLDGAGTFGPARVIDTFANGATSVFAMDVDGDADVDILSASFFDNRIAWYENLDGNGSFGPQQVVSTGAIGAYAVFALDLDGDGDTDVLSASQNDDKIAWYENESDDCNGNVVPDSCDIIAGTSLDCSGNGVPDECEPDCNGNGAADSCDIDSGTSEDCNGNGLPDDCEPDCNANGVADSCDVDSGRSLDCNGNGTPDECEIDCNANGIPDECDVAAMTSEDCNGNGIPDECEIDCNGNAVPDDCDIGQGRSDDCDDNSVPDECDPDCNGDGVPNACDVDCNQNDVPDGCEPDCNENGTADECDIVSGPSSDCNGNGIPDECEVRCIPPCDADGDRCVDDLDSHPNDPTQCADTDLDGCDDCTSGVFNTANDGPDTDGDGICDVGDCDIDEPLLWFEPGPAHSLVLSVTGGSTTLTWEAPEEPGASSIEYDTLRSPSPSDFEAPAICLASDSQFAMSEEFDTPSSGARFHYLIRVENGCPGPGSMGTDSEAVPRSGRPCP